MGHLFLMFLDHTQQCTTVGRTPLDEWSVRRRDLYLTTHDTHNRQISMPPVGFEPTINDLMVNLKMLLPLLYTWTPYSYLDDWLTVHHSITLIDLQLDVQNSYLFTYNTFIKILYMFRALPCSSSGGLRRNCIHAASGISTLQVTVLCTG